MPHEVIMPALGMNQDTGLIVAWHKQAGDAVKAGETLMEVETDKATMEVEAQADGYLVDLRADAGQDVPVGNVVALISDTPDGAGEAQDKAAPPETASGSVAGPASEGNNQLPEGNAVIMPVLGMNQDTGLIVAWRKQAGDKISASDILLEVETDKSVMEVEAGHDGYLAATLAMADEAVPVGRTIAIISSDRPDEPIQRSLADTAGETPAATADDGDAARSEPEPQPPRSRSTDTQVKQTASAGSTGKILASPKAKRLAAERGLDLARLVDAGVSQPFHVADLDQLERLTADTAQASAGMAAAGTPMQLEARVDDAGFYDFLDWSEKETREPVPAVLHLARFASAALRASRDAEQEPLVLDIGSPGSERRRLADCDLFPGPENSGDESPDQTAKAGTADLSLHDLTCSNIVAARLGAANGPVLSISRDQGQFHVSLNVQPHQMSENQAIEFMTGFAGRLENPLRQLL